MINKSLTLLWALAIIWFYLGNLVNFHQNRIWGKLLIPACFTHSSINNKEYSIFSTADADDLSIDILGFGEINFTTDIKHYPLWDSYLPIFTPEHFISQPSTANHRLRGPPVC